jgi:hypothetical protein
MRDIAERAIRDINAALDKASGRRSPYVVLTEEMTMEEKEFEVYSHLRRNGMSEEETLQELPKILDALRMEASPRHSA